MLLLKPYIMKLRKNNSVAKLLLVITLGIISQYAYSQCNVYPPSNNIISFGYEGGTNSISIITEPENCQNLNSTNLDWVSAAMGEYNELSITCSINNTGEPRNGSIYIGYNQVELIIEQAASEPLNGGEISWTTNNLCYNTSPGILTNTTGASGGNCDGYYSYQWQKSTTSSTSGFSIISGATGLTYSPGNLTTTTYFRRSVLCDNIEAFSNVLQITVFNALTAGSIGSAQSICYNTVPLTLTQITAPDRRTRHLYLPMAKQCKQQHMD